MITFAIATCVVAASAPLTGEGSQGAITSSASASDLPRNTLSLELPSLFWGGVSLDGERFSAGRRWSLLLSLGIRWEGEAGYSAWTAAAGLEGRIWLNRLRFWFMNDIGGPYAGLRLDGGLTHLHVHDQGTGFPSGEVDLSVRLGYRFVIGRRVELTPCFGGVMRTVITGTPWLVASPPQYGILGGFTVGYLF